MPTLKQDRTLMKRHFRDMLYLGVPFVLILLVAAGGTYWFHSMLFFASAFVFGLPLAIVGLVRQIRRNLHFPCPTCGTMLDRSDDAKSGSPITFLCTACDTEWGPGFRTGSDKPGLIVDRGSSPARSEILAPSPPIDRHSKRFLTAWPSRSPPTP